ncbi:MAG: hypothetical protein HC822_24830, partial [Oscillochloris sp.]|nr:hypothetical protein [Oscillochloris sp.]
RLYLYDAAPEVRARLIRRFAEHERIEVLDDAGLADTILAGRVDLMVVNSVLQYVPPEGFATLLATARRLLSQATHGAATPSAWFRLLVQVSACNPQPVFGDS